VYYYMISQRERPSQGTAVRVCLLRLCSFVTDTNLGRRFKSAMAAHPLLDPNYAAPPKFAQFISKTRALSLLRTAVGSPTAEFHPDQWEAIQLLLHRERLLVVERTGWGKSSVYFLATRLLRDTGSGCTLLISPLLSLMRNQIASARRIGVRAETINSSNMDDWPRILNALRQDRVDILLISPERLAREDFVTDYLLPIAARIGLFVVDEAHCISDWGHDFRPDYRRIVRILRALPANVPVLATTATANDRVVTDLLEQLGPNLTTIRGPLARESLMLQNIVPSDKAARMAWIADHISSLPGSGIIYTLTVKDANTLAIWLQSRGIRAAPYHADLESDEREKLEEQLLGNHVKALVATVALGMGFDKPDIGFVVHFQRPPSVIHYYQQVGRAGRAIPEAHGILLSGDEDDEIADYFIRTAFPTTLDVDQLLAALGATKHGLKHAELQRQLNFTDSNLHRTLQFLLMESPSPIQKLDERFVRNPVPWQMPIERIQRILQLRRHEQQRIRQYVETDKCLMQFLSDELNDPAAHPCGKCSNCQHAVLDVAFPSLSAEEATWFLTVLDLPIPPRKQWLSGHSFEGQCGKISPCFQNQPGRTLCQWGDPGFGELVRNGKHQLGRFSDRLLAAAVALIRERWIPQPAPAWVTCVPSRRHGALVPDFARRLAGELRLPFVDCIHKVKETEPQKTRRNSLMQMCNLERAFDLNQATVQIGPVLLVDDLVDSRWTFTVLGFNLRQAGSGPVFPFALADSSTRDEIQGKWRR
jgi:ATP-dependent DNA helicase RecQ